MINLLLIILLLLVILCFYMLNRNNKVYYFTTGLNRFLFNELTRILDTYENDNEFHEDESNYYNIREKVCSLLNKHSYNEYLFSFKSLKLEKWFSKEDLEFMAYLRQYRK